MTLLSPRHLPQLLINASQTGHVGTGTDLSGKPD